MPRNAFQRKLGGHRMRRLPGSGRQRCQEALRRGQTGREGLRPRAGPDAGSQHCVQCQGSAWVLSWGSPLAGPQGLQGGFQEGHLHPACLPTAEGGVSLWSMPWCPGVGLPLGAADPSSLHPPCKSLAWETRSDRNMCPCCCISWSWGWDSVFSSPGHRTECSDTMR